MASLHRVTLALSLVLGASACAAEGCGPYRVGLREYPRFYERHAATGLYTGLDKDFFDALAERSGCQLHIQIESQPRLWRRLAEGQIDMASWVVPSAEREQWVRIVPLIQGRMMAMTWRDADLKQPADFLNNPALRAVAIRQALYGAEHDELLAKLRLQGRLSETADFDTALRAFAARRVALMFVYPWSLASQPADWLAQVRLTDWHPEAPAVTSGLALSLKTIRDPDAERLRRAVAAMQQDGSFARIVARHLPPKLIQPVPPR
jgi:polar amino acid transport system substrate-binding protein